MGLLLCHCVSAVGGEVGIRVPFWEMIEEAERDEAKEQRATANTSVSCTSAPLLCPHLTNRRPYPFYLLSTSRIYALLPAALHYLSQTFIVCHLDYYKSPNWPPHLQSVPIETVLPTAAMVSLLEHWSDAFLLPLLPSCPLPDGALNVCQIQPLIITPAWHLTNLLITPGWTSQSECIFLSYLHLSCVPTSFRNTFVIPIPHPLFAWMSTLRS